MPSDEALLQEIRDRFSYADTEWDPIRKEAQLDMKYVAGDPWTEKDRSDREKAGRPCLSLDELGQYHNQVINDLRANPRGMKFSPVGNGANDKGAEFYANKAREIEYRSSAQVAYITAAENMVQRSYGWVRLRTEYESDRSANLRIVIDPVMNPDNVVPDPDAVWPDSRDLRYLFYLESRSVAEFKREFKDAKIRDFTAEHARTAPAWIKGDRVQIAEYWAKELVTKRLLIFGELPPKDAAVLNGRPFVPQYRGIFEDELQNGRGPEGYEFKRERTDVETWKVVQYLTNGVEILDTRPWPGKYIPFVSCFGKVIYVNEGGGTKRKILSMTRLARDPYMLYCYYRTCEAELVGMTPKFPYFVFKGQLDPDELLKLQKSLHEPIAVIQVNPTVNGAPQGQVLGFPTRQPYEPPIMGLEAGAEAARRAIQAAMGISPLPTQAQRHNEKSGKALQQIEASGQRGSFHFVDHYNGLIEMVGRQFENLEDKIDDTPREIWVRTARQTSERVPINQPGAVSTVGDYDVTVSVGPADDSQRDAANEFIESVAQPQTLGMVAQLRGPNVAAKLLATGLRNRQLGPLVDDLADAIDPPAPNGQDGKPIPPELQQAMGKIQQLQQALEQAAKEKEAEGAKYAAQAEIEKFKAAEASRLKELDIAWQREKAHLEAETRVDVAALGAKVKDLEMLVESRLRVADIAHDREQMAHEALEATKDRLHDVNMAQMGHAQAMDQAAQGHDQALELADQGIQGQIDVANAAPQPTNGTGAEA